MELDEIRNVFVTVGTTKFDGLIEVISSSEILKILSEIGCKELIIQLGSSKIPNNLDNFELSDMSVKYYKYKNSLEQDIISADLIISHCGSGTIFECLKLKKKVVAVVNETLMGNHQFELANTMEEQKYLLKTIPSKLLAILKDPNFFDKISDLEEIQEPETDKFAKIVYNELGILEEED